MSIPEPISILAGAITEAVFGYILEKSGWAEELRRRLGRDPERLAFQRGVEQALAAFQRDHATWYADLLDASFLKNEGAPVLAELLRPSGEPDAALLAEQWAASLRSTDDVRRHVLAAQCEPAAYTLLSLLGDALKDQKELRELNNERRFEQIAVNMGRLLAEQGVGEATPMTRRAYLRWLVDRYLYLDPHGVLQTQRQVQLKLDEIYLSLAAEAEPEPGSSDRRLRDEEESRLAAELDVAGLGAEEREDRRELLLSRLAPLGAAPHGAPVEMHALVRERAHLAVLGDPGSGKTTLLRYLALQHAQALLAGRHPGDPHPQEGLGGVRFPVLVRIGDYVEAFAGGDKALTDALGELHIRAECAGDGLQELFTTELEAGGCLLLLDGLDEVVSADDRLKVVKAIENFVRRHQAGGRRGANHFVVTSRKAGYRSAPLAAPFAHYSVQEMDETHMRRFLERWCRAVEDAETPEKSPQQRQATAQAEIDGLMEAVHNNAGVRRLAANPLLLRILALIHRTGATLPQRRIELYRLAADTLARTWRRAQGVTQSALVEDHYLTPLLGKLAYWMHAHRPSGIASERDVYALLGREYARMKRLEWEEGGDNPEVVAEVRKFLVAVREHTGLFVERAPQRYGFMHLTFEEYYAARDLVARLRDAPRRIREHLHDPRWDEPILLALGFVGLNSAEEAAALVDTAVLAQGEDAQALGFTPSPYEEWLGRDYRFALRCAGDLIPLSASTQADLVARLQGEVLREEGLGRFSAYHSALNDLLPLLATSALGKPLIYLAVAALRDDKESVRSRAAASLGQLGQATPEVVSGLISALLDDDKDALSRAAKSLGQLRQAVPEVVSSLLSALRDDDAKVRIKAAAILVILRQATPEVVSSLLSALRDANTKIRISAAAILIELGQAMPEVVSDLLSALRDGDEGMRLLAIAILVHLGRATPEVMSGLHSTPVDDAGYLRFRWMESSGHLGQATQEVVSGWLYALRDSDAGVRSLAAMALGQLGQVTPEVLSALLSALGDDNVNVRYGAAESLAQLGEGAPEVLSGLLSALGDDGAHVRTSVAGSLGKLGQATAEVVSGLLSALGDDEESVRSSAAASLVELGQATAEVVSGLLSALRDDKMSVRSRAAASLGQLGKRNRTTRQEIIKDILAELENSSAANEEAYTVLLQLTSFGE